jgi:hypothetical protein
MPDQSRFNSLRENVSPELAHLPDRQLAEALAARKIDAEAMEGFFDDLGKFAARAAPAILPIAGQVVGGIYGGPAGAAIGGQLGQLAGGAISSATGQRPAAPAPRPAPRPAAPPPPPPPAMAPPGAEPMPAAPSIAGASAPIDPGAGSPAAGQLLQTITRPETLQALASMAMGSSGRTDIPVGGTSVPVSAFSNLIGVLAGQAEAEYAESIARAENAVPVYMRGEWGEARGDPAVEEDRAHALYRFLGEQEAYGESGESEWAESESESESESAESEADAAELVELAYELSESESESESE